MPDHIVYKIFNNLPFNTIDTPDSSPAHTHDALIFGGGLAGSILAQRFIDAGKSILLVDNPKKSNCSRVAAGLINPIPGKRLKRAWMLDQLFPAAIDFYHTLEAKHQTPLFHPRPIHRYFSTPEETNLWHSKRARNPHYTSLTVPLPEGTPNGFAIPQAGYLDTSALLDLIHAQLTQNNALLSSTFHYNEIQIAPNGVTFRNHTAPLAIFAEGHLATGNPHFSFIPYKPAKGIIASITLSTQNPAHQTHPILLKQKFLVPRHDGSLLVGATYNWDDPTDTPDEAGIQELATFLDAEFGPNNWSFDQIKAGVRPATAGAYPVIGRHPDIPQLVAFNGFGSKGSLQIPYFSQQLLNHLYHDASLIPEVLPTRFVKKPKAKPQRWIATDVAKERVLQILRSGELAIDATAGNGHDTHWLAQTVAPSGHVFAFDLQAQAIANTRQRLDQANLSTHTTLLQQGHETLLKAIPKNHHGQIAAIVFNLGFLPGGNPSLITRADTTLAALDASLTLLKPKGILSITLYPTHPGAQDEVASVLDWFHNLPPSLFITQTAPHPQNNPNSPYPIFITKN